MVSLPPSIQKAIKKQREKDVQTGRTTRVVVPRGGRFKGSTPEQIIAKEVKAKATPAPEKGITQAEIQKRVAEKQTREEQSEQRIKETQERKERLQPKTPEQKALALTIAQEIVKASPQFEALRARRLAEEKQKFVEVSRPAEVIVGGGKLFIKGRVKKFAPDKRKIIEKPKEAPPFTGEITEAPSRAKSLLSFVGREIKAGTGELVTPLIEEFKAFQFAKVKPIIASTRLGPIKIPKLQQSFILSSQQATQQLPATRRLIAGATLITGIGLFAPAAAAVASFPLVLVAGLETAKTSITGEPPTLSRLIRTGTQVLVFEAISRASKKIQRVIAKKKATPKQIVEFEAREGTISPKELKAVKKLALEQKPLSKVELEAGFKEGVLRVDINKLSEKQILTLIKLQSEGKIESFFELTLKAEPKGQIGLVIKSKRGVSEFELALRKKVSEAFLKAFEKQARKSRAQRIEASISDTRRQLALEKRIRAEMAKTGKTAKEIFADIQQEQKAIEMKPEKPFTKKLSKGAEAPSGADPFGRFGKNFKELDNRFGGVSRLVSGRRQKLLLVEKLQFIRGMRPVSDVIELEIPNVRLLADTGPIAIGAGASIAVRSALSTLEIQTQLQRELQQQRQKQQQDIIQEQRALQRQVQEASTLSIQDVRLKAKQQDIIQEQRALQRQSVWTILEQIQVPITITDIVQTPITKQTLTTQQPLRRPLELKIEVEKLSPIKKKIDAFNAFVQQKGRLIKVNKEPLPKNAAINLALSLTDQSTAVTAKIKPSIKPTTRRFDDFLDTFTFSKFDIRKDKRDKGNIFVEKNQFRIDSYGEIKGIPLAGLLARRKRRFGGFI